MRKNLALVLLLAITVVMLPAASYGQTLRLSTMLDKLTKPNATSMQVLNLIEGYKGQTVKGQGRVKDILKSFGDEKDAMVYIDKPYRGKTYEIIVVTNEASVEKLRKDRPISFAGTFAGMTFRTLRFEAASVKAKPWYWPF